MAPCAHGGHRTSLPTARTAPLTAPPHTRPTAASRPSRRPTPAARTPPTRGLYPSQFRYLFAYIPAAVGYGVIVFDKWAWRWPVIHRFTGRPWATGTWRVVLSPSPESRILEGGNRGPITTYMTVEQTFWSLHATLRTKESTSRSSNATIGSPENSGTAEIGFLYDNTPRAEHQHRSPRHEGACRISVTGLNPRVAAGHYYTSRFTAGDMDFTLINRSTDYCTFAEAQAADPEHTTS